MNDFTFSQFIFAIGTILMIRRIIKSRSIIEGYDPAGAFITLIAMSYVLKGFIGWGDWIGLVAGSIQWVFWFLAFSFSLRNWLKNRGKKK